MKSLLVAGLIFIWLPAIIFKPYVGVMVWSWVSYMIPQSYTYGFAASFPFLVLVGGLTAFGTMFTKEKTPLPMHPTIICMILFLVWTYITYGLAYEPSYGAKKIDKFTKVIVFALLSSMLMQTPQRIKMFYYVLVASLLFIAVKGGIFTAATGGNARVQGAGGMMNDNNQLAMAMAMLFPLSIYLVQYPPLKIMRWPLIAACVTVPLSVIGTHSRGGLVALLATFFMFVLKSRYKFRILVVAIPLGIVGANFMPESWTNRMESTNNATEDGSFMGRVSMWKYATNLTAKHPIEGGGFDVFYVPRLVPVFMPSGYKQRAPHSIYFEVLGEHGYVGLFLFMTMLFTGWYAGGTNYKRFRPYKETRWLGDMSNAMQISIVGFAAGGITVNVSTFDVFYHLLVSIALCRLVGDRIMERGVTEFGSDEPEEADEATETKAKKSRSSRKWAPSKPTIRPVPAERSF